MTNYQTTPGCAHPSDGGELDRDNPGVKRMGALFTGLLHFVRNDDEWGGRFTGLLRLSPTQIAFARGPITLAMTMCVGEKIYNIAIINMPAPAARMAATVIQPKYFFAIMFAMSRNRHSNAATIANRDVRNIADTPKNSHAGKPINPAHIAINLYGIGVNAVRAIIKIPCVINNCCAISNFSILAKFSISHIPTESNKKYPIRYEIAPPTIDPIDAAVAIGTARRRLAMMGGAIKTSGGTNKNIDSHTVNIKTIHAYAGCSDFFNTDSTTFIFYPGV